MLIRPEGKQITLILSFSHSLKRSSHPWLRLNLCVKQLSLMPAGKLHLRRTQTISFTKDCGKALRMRMTLWWVLFPCCLFPQRVWQKWGQTSTWRVSGRCQTQTWWVIFSSLRLGCNQHRESSNLSRLLGFILLYLSLTKVLLSFWIQQPREISPGRIIEFHFCQDFAHWELTTIASELEDLFRYFQLQQMHLYEMILRGKHIKLQHISGIDIYV